jgi:kynurenine formamidase
VEAPPSHRVVRRAVDLTVPLDAATQGYPGDPPVSVRRVGSHADPGYVVSAVSLGSHAGTHVDAPYHVDPAGARVDELDLALLAGPAVVLDVRGAGAREPVRWTALEPYADVLRTRRIAVLRTGWSVHYGTDRYWESPWLDPAACRRLLDLGVRTLLLDCASPDPVGSVELPVHRLIAAAGGVVGENLTGLDRLDFDPWVTCLPLRLTGGDAAPVRAVALDLS